MAAAANALKSPYPWFGGKSRVANLVWSQFGEVRNYVEPFFGSGAVLLQRPQPFKGVETINDKDRFVANFWRALKADPEAVAEWTDWPVNECVAAGTMIATPNGDLPAEDVREGMIVWGFDGVDVVPTAVVATKRSFTDEPLVRVGDLGLTGNHPVWTNEAGYVESRNLVPGLTVVSLMRDHHDSNMDYLHAVRPSHGGGSVRRRDISRQGSAQGAFIASENQWAHAPRLLDSVLIEVGRQADSTDDPGWLRRWMARGRADMDRALSVSGQTCEPYGWGRGDAGLCPDARTTSPVERASQGPAVCARATIGDVWQSPLSGINREDSRVEHGSRSHEDVEGETIGGSCRQIPVGRASSQALGGFTRRAAKSTRCPLTTFWRSTWTPTSRPQASPKRRRARSFAHRTDGAASSPRTRSAPQTLGRWSAGERRPQASRPTSGATRSEPPESPSISPTAGRWRRPSRWPPTSRRRRRSSTTGRTTPSRSTRSSG